jgi:hypothetical protein
MLCPNKSFFHSKHTLEGGEERRKRSEISAQTRDELNSAQREEFS